MKYTIFWVLISLTLVFIGIDWFFFRMLDLIIIMLFLDFLALFLVFLENGKQIDNTHHYIGIKLDTIEKICEQILSKVFTPETARRLKEEEREAIKWLENF